MGIPEGDNKENETGSTFKAIMAVNFLERELDIQIYEVQKIPEKLNPNRAILRHIIIKSSMTKRIVKEEKRKLYTRGL